ncbi:MAG: 3-deoxy-manno-octulosonate cytidylyltransferase [Fimbriimonadaceae bacterium]
MRCAIVIPARMGSTRFPGKPLVDLMGKPMVRWVFDAAVKADVADRVLVATPDQEIVEACRAFGAEAVLTSPDHASGTDRIAEVAQKLDADVYVNVQGDEPLMPVETVRACARALLDDPAAELSSVYGDCPPEEEDDPNVVKVVTDEAGYALYFSRHAIPFPRNPRPIGLKKHIGIYGYRRDPLLAFSTWPVGKLEAAESLEQLRFLEKGYRMKMAFGRATPLAVDTPDQAERVRQILAGL